MATTKGFRAVGTSTPGRFRLRVVSTRFFWAADGTRSMQDARCPGTKRGCGSQNRLTMQCAQWNASRDVAWRRRRVAVARPVRIVFVRNFVLSRVSRKRRKSAKCGNTVP